ncbi:bifunctional hydroxymethylpyrimidine kinase/phosphomethylpyrimidine kinase [Furfurilactobacillus siliginis]|nr:bifunctional hydroxymethylpyrimidine kinase/phosphomethylpyrimidine kinase [Furfurilactobacillus siliginis]GEK28266.1 hydroxymethylpyrimidine/phosphomethylpyrimidine kinase [Furfurilactobacillus siliginis]
MANEFPQVVTIAGSDSDGSAGLQADLSTFFTRHVHGMSIVTACVAGNSYGIQAATAMPTDFIDQQFTSLADDFDIRASKTGMLADASLINNVVANYQRVNFGPLVVDPVIVTKHGALLLEAEAFETLRERLLPLATVITPNFYEAEKLTDRTLKTDADVISAAHQLQKMGAKNVIVKGKHADTTQSVVRDFVLLENGDHFWLSAPYIQTDHVNGTGDSLSACITAELGKGASVKDAITLAKAYVNAAIANEIAVGHKLGPINHWAFQD